LFFAVFTDLNARHRVEENISDRKPSGRIRRGPFDLQEKDRLIAHAARAPDHGFDRRVQRFDHTEADVVKTVRGDSVEMLCEKLTSRSIFWQSLPPQGHQPADQEIRDAH
jgi:hypothetical protein